MNKILIILTFLSIHINAGGVLWSDPKNIEAHFKNSHEVFKAKIISFTLTTRDKKVINDEEFFLHMQTRNYLQKKIRSLQDLDGDDPWVLDEYEDNSSIQKIIKETNDRREELIKYYKKKLALYPYIKGEVSAKLKLTEIYKGKIKEEAIINCSFSYNPGSMCPHPTEKTLDKNEYIWYRLIKNEEYYKVMNLEYEKELINQISKLKR